MGRRSVVLGSATAVIAVATVATAGLVVAGVGLHDAAAWLWVLGAGVVFPGFVVTRLVRGPGSWAEDLAWSLPVGLLVCLVLARVAVAVDTSAPVAATGGMAVALLLVPTLRRRVLVRTRGTWGTPVGVVVVTTLVATVGWAVGGTLVSSPVAPPGPFRWGPDVMFHVALAAEVGRSDVPVYPMVPEGPYPYHWFFHALAAHLGQGYGPLVVVTHLLPLTLLLGVVAMGAVAAREIAGHPWAAAVGAVSTGALGSTQPGAWGTPSGVTGRADAEGAGLDPVRLYWETSPTTTLGWLAALAILAATARILRLGPRHARGEVVLVLLMAVLAAGAKSSQTPVLLGGVALVMVVAALGRRPQVLRRAGLVGALLAGPWLLALLTVYAGGSHGVSVDPGARAVTLAARLTPALVTVDADGGRSVPPLVLVVAVLLWLAPLLPRLLGLLWWARGPVEPLAVFCGGTLLSGLAATFVLSHPASSETYFLVSAYPVAVVGSAAGLTLAAARLHERLGRGAMAGVVAAAAVFGVVLTAGLSRWAGSEPPTSVWAARRPGVQPAGADLSVATQLLSWAGPTLVLTVVVGVVLAGALVLLHRLVPALPLAVGGLVIGTTTLMSGGLVATARDVGAGRPAQVALRLDEVRERAPARTRVRVTPELWRAAAIVRAEAGPDDVVVTNRACLQTARVLARRPCDPRDFVVSALTGRRTGVSGWAYAPTSLQRATDVPGGYARMPFWDPARRAAQLDLVERPTEERAAAAWARGERWVLADRTSGPVSASLDDIGDVVLDRRSVLLVRLRPPVDP